jgi:charged multivesicular body protein 4
MPQDELAAELEALEQEELDDRLKGADHVPVHTPASPVANGRERQFLISTLRKLVADLTGVHAQAEEDDEEAQLRQLQAELAM